MQLSCKSRLARLFLKLSRGTVVQKLRCEPTPHSLAWGCLAKAAFRNYFASFCMATSCKGCLSKLYLIFLSSWSCPAKDISQSCFPQFYMEPPRKRIVRQRSWAQSELCWAQSNQSVRDAACSSRAQVPLRSYFLSFCIELSCQSCLAESFLKLLHGTVVQNLLCEAIF